MVGIGGGVLAAAIMITLGFFLARSISKALTTVILETSLSRRRPRTASCRRAAIPSW